MGVYFSHCRFAFSMMRDWKNCQLKTFNVWVKVQVGPCPGQAVPCPVHPIPESVSQPGSGCQSLAYHGQCSIPAPGASNPTPEWPNDLNVSPAGRIHEGQGYLKQKSRKTHVLVLPPLGIPVS